MPNEKDYTTERAANNARDEGYKEAEKFAEKSILEQMTHTSIDKSHWTSTEKEQYEKGKKDYYNSH